MSHPMLNSTFWTAIGPAPIDTAGGMGPISGRIEAVVADPTNPKVIYLGADNGGIWKVGGGARLNLRQRDFMPAPSSSMDGRPLKVVHPANQQSGLRSRTLALAWGFLNSNWTPGAAWALLANGQFDGSSLLALVAHPTNTSLLYMAAGRAGVWTSTGRRARPGRNWEVCPADMSAISSWLALTPKLCLRLSSAIAAPLRARTGSTRALMEDRPGPSSVAACHQPPPWGVNTQAAQCASNPAPPRA